MYLYTKLKAVVRAAYLDYKREKLRSEMQELFTVYSDQLARTQRPPYGWSNPVISRYLRRQRLESYKGPWYV